MRAILSVAFLFSLGKNRCETDLCSTKIGGDNHTKTIQKSETGVEFIPRSTHRTAQLQRTVSPLHPLLQAKFSLHRSDLFPLRKQAQHKVLKTHPNHCKFRRAGAVMKVSAAEIIVPYTGKKIKNTHLFPTEKVPFESYLAIGTERRQTHNPKSHKYINK